jgi:hypothetical protein
MAADKVRQVLVEALKRGLIQPGEHRLYRSGKLEGLFPGRTGASAEAAARALREGLIEVARTETRGKTTIDWVQLTPKAVDFVHEHESPLRALQDLRAELQLTREGVPAWQAEMRRQLAALGDRLAADSERLLQRVEALGRRVEEALERLKLLGPHLPDELTAAVPWAQEALEYLDRRRSSGAATPCPLPELFGALSGRRAEFSIPVFHDGLRRLHDRRVLSLLPCTAVAEEMAQPEYALIDNGSVLYYVTS